jgi:cell division inhibitor SepF
MGKLLEKIGRVVGIDYEEEDEIVEEYEEYEPARDHAHNYLRSSSQASKPTVVPMPQSKASKMLIFQPASFDEVQVMATSLKNRSTVVINLSSADSHVGKRILDFMSGTVYALGGGVTKVSDEIIIFTPDNVDVSQRDALLGEYGERHRLPWER